MGRVGQIMQGHFKDDGFCFEWNGDSILFIFLWEALPDSLWYLLCGLTAS